MDSRDIAHSLRWWVFTDGRMAYMIGYSEEDEDGTEVHSPIPVDMIVCPTCDGRGTYVNPNIDRQGLSYEDFDTNPGFRESYWNGEYDIRCEHCQGANVIPHPTEQKHRDLVEELLEDRAYAYAEQDAERRMGA